MNRKAQVYMHDSFAGELWETDEGYSFKYNNDYVNNKMYAVSKTLPLTSQEYKSKTLFPFFDGLIPEGWLLDIVEQNWKLNPKDRMGILLACCKDCIGAVSVLKL
jgi:serine/threonine-protein kinase HipA